MHLPEKNSKRPVPSNHYAAIFQIVDVLTNNSYNEVPNDLIFPFCGEIIEVVHHSSNIKIFNHHIGYVTSRVCSLDYNHRLQIINCTNHVEIYLKVIVPIVRVINLCN